MKVSNLQSSVFSVQCSVFSAQFSVFKGHPFPETKDFTLNTEN